MDIVVLIGRLLFGLLFVGSAFGHLTQTEGMAQYAGAKGVPSARLAVQLSGLMILVGGVMVILGVWADLGALLLVVFLLLTSFVMHPFWKATDQERQMEQVQFLKDLGLAGAALMLFAFFAASPDLGLTITGPLFEASFG
jgi:putative oxidoreductase